MLTRRAKCLLVVYLNTRLIFGFYSRDSLDSISCHLSRHLRIAAGLPISRDDVHRAGQQAEARRRGSGTDLNDNRKDMIDL